MRERGIENCRNLSIKCLQAADRRPNEFPVLTLGRWSALYITDGRKEGGGEGAGD